MTMQKVIVCPTGCTCEMPRETGFPGFDAIESQSYTLCAYALSPTNPIMPHFRCQSVSNQPQQHGMHKSVGVSGQWARYLQAGSAANLHRLRHALPKHVRNNQHSFALFASSAPAQAATRPKVPADTDSELFDCVIVGAGISGLTLAQAFASEHPDTVSKVLITEAQDRVGGNITSKQTADGFLYETGPNSFQPSDPVLKLAVSLPPTLHGLFCHRHTMLLLVTCTTPLLQQ